MSLLQLTACILFSTITVDTAGNHTTEKETSTNGINWVSLELAQQAAKTEPKNIFIDVYTDWCGYCKKMDQNTFSDSSVVNYVNENFYAVKLNAESTKKVTFKGVEMTEQELSRVFRVRGYPTIVFMDETFEQVAPLSGYRSAQEFKAILMQFDKVVSPWFKLSFNLE